jgi:phosphate transport system substrate-binding protein
LALSEPSKPGENVVVTSLYYDPFAIVAQFGIMRLFATSVVILWGLVATVPAAAEPLTLQGSTTLSSRLMIPYQRDIENLSQQKLIVVPNKSSLGIQALFEKNAQFGMISGPLEVEVKSLRKTLASAPFDQLKEFEIARTRMSFAVHPDNPVRTITIANLRRILLGEIRNWKEVGGRDIAIRLVMVREGGGVQASVENEVLKGHKIVAPDPIRVQIGSQVVKVVMQEPGTLGLAQLGVARRAGVPELALDDPVDQTLSFVALGAPTPAMQSVIDAARQVARKVLE